MQLTLDFDSPPPAMAVETSQQAAARIRPCVGELRRRVLRFIIGRGDDGANDQEIAEELGLRGDTARTRRCELRDQGLVHDSGRRRPTPSGRTAVVWVANDY